MAIGDQIGKQTADEITDKTIPEINANVHGVLDRLNGATVTVNLFGHPITLTLNIPGRK